VTLRAALREALAQGTRKVTAFTDPLGARAVDFPVPPGGPDPFLNLNTPEDLVLARRWLR
jgi:molybdopterin-guanine dinucleotide biosynthesis protein A